MRKIITATYCTKVVGRQGRPRYEYKPPSTAPPLSVIHCLSVDLKINISALTTSVNEEERDFPLLSSRYLPGALEVHQTMVFSSRQTVRSRAVGKRL